MNWASFLQALLVPPVIATFWTRVLPGWHYPRDFYGSWIVGATLCSVLDVLPVEGDHWSWSRGNAISAIAGIITWWWTQRRRKHWKAVRSYGAKSLARLAALVRKARESSLRPRPVLRPVPQGTR